MLNDDIAANGSGELRGKRVVRGREREMWASYAEDGT